MKCPPNDCLMSLEGRRSQIDLKNMLFASLYMLNSWSLNIEVDSQSWLFVEGANNSFSNQLEILGLLETWITPQQAV